MPLHGGRVPRWLSERMERLGRVVVEALILEYGREEVLRRLAHPFWFQSLGCVMGMDWHSSGITTSVMGALKRSLAPVEDELGIYVCGGRGKASRKTPAELLSVASRTGLDGQMFGRYSRLVAKIDSAALQDGFQIYLHNFVVDADGNWVVVQQGMDTESGFARRYHWLSEGLESFTDDPHAGIDGNSRGALINLVDSRSSGARQVSLDLVEEGPDRTLKLLREARRKSSDTPIAEQIGLFDHLDMPAHHDVRPSDVNERRFHAAIAAASDTGPEDFETLLLTKGLGARTLESLALVAEVLHGKPSRFQDPARFSMAHGGKDGYPFPVPLDIYDETIRVMRSAVRSAHLGRRDQMEAMRRLDAQSRSLEAVAEGQGINAYIKKQRELAPFYGGMTTDGPATGDVNFPSPLYPKARKGARADAAGRLSREPH